MLAVLVMNGILFVIAVVLIIAERLLVTYGECKITINKEKILAVSGGDSLLSYFSQNKIFIPSACGGKATCGYCKVEVLSGAGHILPTEEVFVSREDRLKGIRLACQVKVRNDIEVLISDDLLQAKEYKTRISQISDVTNDIKYVVMQLSEPNEINFKPGQYIQFRIPEIEEFRAYSIASPPSQKNTLELVVRLVPGGLCSSYIHEVLDVQDEITITGPYGDFYLREDSQREIVCIGGGCGMAPIRSILYYLREKGMPRKVSYFFGARSKNDLFYTEELRALEKEFPGKFTYHPVLSEPKPDDKWAGETGFVTQSVERHMHSGANTESYLCGPPPMIDAALKVLTKKGVQETHIYYDKF